MPTGAGARPPLRSAADRCPCPNAGEFSQASKEAWSRHRVTTSQVVRSSVGLRSSKPSKPSWLSTALARAANGRASSSPLSGGTVIALIFTTVMCSMMPPVATELRTRRPPARARSASSRSSCSSAADSSIAFSPFVTSVTGVSLFVRSYTVEVTVRMKKAQRAMVGGIAYRPLALGLLSGKYHNASRQSNVAADDLELTNDEYIPLRSRQRSSAHPWAGNHNPANPRHVGSLTNPQINHARVG